MARILVINPGSTSTKLAWFEGERAAWTDTLAYTREQLAAFTNITDQFGLRRGDIDRSPPCSWLGTKATGGTR